MDASSDSVPPLICGWTVESWSKDAAARYCEEMNADALSSVVVDVTYCGVYAATHFMCWYVVEDLEFALAGAEEYSAGS